MFSVFGEDKMNVYDWDNTIYQGDSTFGLIKYCYKKRPKSLLSLPRTLVCGILYLIGIMPKKKFKETMFSMFKLIPDIDKVVDDYVHSHLSLVKPWYYQQQRSDDLVISASPEFLVKAFCKEMGITNVIASPVNIHTGKYEGDNCHGEEKVLRFKQVFQSGSIDSFYSDSYSDSPLAKLAKNAYVVKGNERKAWNKE